MRPSFFVLAVCLLVSAGCADDPIYWPIGITDVSQDTQGDAAGGDVSGDATESDTGVEDTSEDPVEQDVLSDAGPDVSEPDVSEPDVSEPDVSEPDVSEPDVSEPDVVEDVEPDADPAAICDDGGPEHSTCDDCQAVEVGAGGCCQSEAEGCSRSSACVDLANCFVECGGEEACVQGCVEEHPDGYDPYVSYVTCLIGETGGGGACGISCGG